MNAIMITKGTGIEIEHDCDGIYSHEIPTGDIFYTCCSHLEKNKHLFMGNGDGDSCPNCGEEIIFIDMEWYKDETLYETLQRKETK